MKKILLVILLTIILCSCSTTKYIEIPVETIKKEYISTTIIDSIEVHDSIDRYLKGDTFYIYKEHTVYRNIAKVDTIERVDTIPVVVKEEVIKEVKTNHINWYQKILMWIGGIVSSIIVCYIIYKCKFKWK